MQDKLLSYPQGAVGRMDKAVVKNLKGNISTTVKGAMPVNVAVGSGAEANSGAVMVKDGSNVGGNITVISGKGITVNDTASPISFGQNVNVAVGVSSNKSDMVMK